MGNLGFKDTVMSSNLFKLRIYLLEFLVILFVYGQLLINKLLHKIFKVGFRLGRIKGLLFHMKSKWVVGFGVWVIWRV